VVVGLWFFWRFGLEVEAVADDGDSLSVGGARVRLLADGRLEVQRMIVSVFGGETRRIN
jgi:hypothetical protein